MVLIMMVSAQSKVGYLLLVMISIIVLSKKVISDYRIRLSNLFYLMILIMTITTLIINLPKSNMYSNLVNILNYIQSDIYTSDYLPPRLRTWYASIQVILTNPLYGLGVYGTENFFINNEVTKHNHLTNEDYVISTHGAFFEILSYYGLIVFLAFVALLMQFYKLFSSCYKFPIPDFSIPPYFYAKFYLISLIIVNITADSFGLMYSWFFLYLFYKALASSHER